MALQSMPYNTSIDFAARMLLEINQAEFHSIEQRIARVEVVAKLGLQRIVSFALLWVRNCGLLDHFAEVSRNKLIKARSSCSCQDTRFNNKENSENTEHKINLDNQNVNYKRQ